VICFTIPGNMEKCHRKYGGVGEGGETLFSLLSVKWKDPA